MQVKGTGIWKVLADNEMRLYQYNLEKGRVIMQGAAIQQYQKDIAKINVKYDTGEEEKLSAESDKLYNKKLALVDSQTQIKDALKDIEDIKLALYTMLDGAKSGDSYAYDTGLRDLNLYAGSSTGPAENQKNLIGNRNRGSWGSTVSLATVGSQEVQIKSQFLGSDFSLVTNTHGTLRFDGTNLAIGGYKPENVELVTPTSAAGVQDGAQITLRVTRPANGSTPASTETITGTLEMGGLNLGTSALYGLKDTSEKTVAIDLLKKEIADLKKNGGDITNAATILLKETELATEEAARATIMTGNQANGAVLFDNVKKALKIIEKAEREYQATSDTMKSSLSSLDRSINDITRKYKTVTEEISTAKQAEMAAAKARADLVDKRYALASNTSVALINSIFSYQDLSAKPSLFDAIGVDQYAAVNRLLGK